jgi:hypothetical protein
VLALFWVALIDFFQVEFTCSTGNYRKGGRVIGLLHGI